MQKRSVGQYCNFETGRSLSITKGGLLVYDFFKMKNLIGIVLKGLLKTDLSWNWSQNFLIWYHKNYEDEKLWKLMINWLEPTKRLTLNLLTFKWTFPLIFRPKSLKNWNATIIYSTPELCINVNTCYNTNQIFGISLS